MPMLGQPEKIKNGRPKKIPETKELITKNELKKPQERLDLSVTKNTT